MTGSSPAHPPTDRARLRVDLLGRVVVRVGDDEVELGGRRPQALVARLALEPGVRVPLSVLAEDLWVDPPPSVDVTLRSIVSRLRRGALGPFLEGGRGGYALDVDPDAVDVVSLRLALRDEREGARRVVVLERVAQAFTGRPLADLGDAPFAVRESERLSHEHVAAVEELAALRIANGEAELAVRSLADLVHRHPLSERPVEVLARTLAELGRDGEALGAIDDLGARLEEEFGIDLPPALVALRTSILRRELAPASTAAEPERLGVPLPITGFVGRRAELAAVVEARAHSRLVTIVGPGGVGKTRIAIEAIRRDPGGDRRQVFVDLVPYRALPELLSALAEQLGALRPDLDAIARMLRDGPTLLVLDNAEHVRDDAAALAMGLLARCDGLAVLVTSRDPLRVPGERRVKVEPMLGDELADAVELLAARAADIEPGFRLDSTTEPLVRALASSLDGIPLALELAAARLPSRSLAELSDDIRRRGIVGGPSSTERHASVTAMIEWSTDLLSPEQGELLGQLGGFAGAFSRDAAVAICDVPGAEVDELLHDLVERSLVSTSRAVDGSTSYRLLIAVREIVRDRYVGDRALWRERHRRWHADLVDEARPRLYTSEEGVATAVLERSAHDLAAALADAAAAGDRESALRIVGGMARVWYRRSALVDGVARIEEALAIPGEAPAILEARAHLGLGLMRFFMRDPGEASRAIDTAIAAAREAGDSSILAIALGYRAYYEASIGSIDAARTSIGEAMGAHGASLAATATVAMIAADLQRFGGAPAAALQGLERALELARRAGEEWVQTLTTHLIAKVLIGAGRAQEAIDLLAPVIRRTWETGRPTHTIAGVFLVAAACASLERHAEGARLLAATDANARRYSWDPDANDPDGNRVHRERLRSALTTSRWEAARASGAALGLGDAVAACVELASAPARIRGVAR
ncbi:hypothetical protein H4J02_02275 [Protaetiibacter sp. SSC-01]|uniref:ATP-binding protein n=1 Tax=Protaetiibacter sp. SSC-01 TaxID=2759943 RepID=UPI0016576305|nr:BTAD domain-containing putative transcriptional regulator [Protaetiibacter sp. SSC-01]QNO37890.1 hypothetical protein H4J02_02275 [Protaetiibacter sp. SSC-01]